MSALWRALRCFVSRFLGQVLGRVECLAWIVGSFLWKGLRLLLNLCHFGWFWLFCWCLFGGTGYFFHSTPCPSATGFPLGPRRRQAAEQRNSRNNWKVQVSWESSFEGKEIIFETTNQQDRYIYIYVCIYIRILYMHVCMYVSIYLSICLSVCLCIYVSMYLCIYVSMYLCIYVSMYVSMYVCIYLSIYLSVCLSVYLCIYVSMYLCIYVSMYVSMYARMYVRMHVRMHACMFMHVCMYVRMYVCMYVCVCLITFSIFYTFIRICMYM